MKTAAIVRRPSTGEKGHNGGSSRKPFFAAPVQRKRRDDEPVQTRLRLGLPGDRFEREADQVADRVVSGERTGPVGAGLADSVTAIGQRQAEEEDERVQAQAEEEEEAVQAKAEEDEEAVQAQAEEEDEQAGQTQAEEEEEAVQAQAEEEEEETVQAQAEEEEEEVQARGSNIGTRVADEVADRIRASRGRGNPLPASVRSRMEQRFGADFSGVRIHTDSAAVELSRAIRAQAFTRGRDIFFNEGRFSPGSRTGEHLLAHELTHTIQQGAVQPDDTQSVRRVPEDSAEGYEARPEVIEAIRLARGEIGKVNAKLHGGDDKRIGWQRLREYFNVALGGPVIHESVIDRVTTVSGKDGPRDALPSWCGIFTWWAMKKAGIPLPDWKLGAPVLDAMKPRPPGELPRKGDIAIDVIPNNHFAMVTGLESTKDARSKPTKLTRVATVNGNTAGEDNLGGQVQEKWDALSRWDHFLDPVGKMNLPDVPLVTVSREPDEAEPVPPSIEQPPVEELGAADETAPRADLADLQTGIEAPVPQSADAVPEADLTLPPTPERGATEEVAPIDKADLSGRSDQAATSFLDATPSSMAATQPDFASVVDGKMKGEQKALVDNPPSLRLKTSGRVDAPLIRPDQLPVPSDATLGDGVKGPDPGGLDPVAGPTPAPFIGNTERERELDREQSGSFWDAFKAFLERFTDGIQTRDRSIDTSVGKAPKVRLTGEADAARMDAQREEGTGKLKSQRDTQVDAFRQHPGQSNIQPRMIDETRPAPVPNEPAAHVTAVTDTAMQDYAKAALPADVRKVADGKIAAKLRPNLAPSRADIVAAGSRRDLDKKNEIDAKQAAADQLNTDTDQAQRRLVIDNRGEVAKLQGDGIREAFENVNRFARDAAAEQSTARRQIGDHVRTEEGRARNKLEDAEQEARKKKEEGEREAEAKKRELKKKQKKRSWWGRVKSAVKSAVKAITKAIDKVFTAVRKAVKFIIEKAKNAAIGLINKARNWVVDKLNRFRDWAKSQVNKYLKDRFPALAKRINNGIDAVTDTAIKGVNKVADAAIAGIERLANALAKALDKILAVFQTALKTAVRVAGAAMTGDFAEALRAAIEGACEIAGINPKPVFDFLDRAGQAIIRILKAPVTFVKDLFGAIGSGLRNFFTNIKQHLIQGVIGWLTGALSEVNLTGPFTFTPKGILNIVLQVLGVTYENIKARVIRRFPKAEKMFDTIEKGFGLLKRLATEGPVALWEEIKASFSNLKELVMGAIRNWLTVTAIKEGITWLLSFTNPASAIVKVVKLVFDLVMFLVERAQQIKDFVVSVYDAVAAMAAGNFKKVIVAVERALARSIPVLISLFAAVLGLGGIAKQVKRVIQKVARPINRAIDKVVDKVVAYTRKLLKRVKAGARKARRKAKAAIEKIIQWWKERRKFKSKDGGSHSIYYKGEATRADLMIASNPDRIQRFLNDKLRAAITPNEQKEVARAALKQYKTVLGHEDELERLRLARKKVSTADKTAYRAATNQINSEIRKFRMALDALKSILERATFENEDDALVRTFVSHSAGGDKSTQALPLTYLSGNEKGSGPFQDPPGWSHAVALDTKPDGSSRNQWVRGHLLNDNLHGPGKANNLVPITQRMNRKMEADVERPAKSAIKQRGKLFFYRAVVTFWKKPPPVDVFPQKIVVTWGDAERKPDDRTQFKEKSAKSPVTISMATPPPENAESFKPSINGGSPGLLLRAIRKQDSGITPHFVSEVLLGDFTDRGNYTSKTNMKTRLWHKGDSVLAAKRRRYVNATYNAITVGDVAV